MEHGCRRSVLAAVLPFPSVNGVMAIFRQIPGEKPLPVPYPPDGQNGQREIDLASRSSGRMYCKSCHFENQCEFNGELAIHFRGLNGLDKPIVWLFPKLRVCFNCGFTEFVVPETELRRLVEGDAA